MAVSGHEVAAYYGKQTAALDGLIAQHNELATKLTTASTTLDTEIAAAQRELAAVYLPALTDDAFARAGRLTGFQGFTRRDPRIALAQERKVLQSALNQLDADERYQRRATLTGADGTLQQELDTAKETLAPLETECARFEGLDGFLELLEVGYDTPTFTEHWWNAGYWRHWSAGDRICKELALDDFGDDVIPAYKKYAEPRDIMRADVQRLEKEIDAVHDVVQKRDQTADRLARLDDIYLASAQDFLGEHLGHADLALLEQWVTPEPEARAATQGLRRLAGVQAKRKIVGEIAQQGVPAVISDLEAKKAKAASKVWKFQRGKNQYRTFDNSYVTSSADAKNAALAAQNAKLQRRLDLMMDYDDYNRFDLRNDYRMWWLYYFNSPPSRYYTPGLYDYYQRNPGITVLEDDRLLDDDHNIRDDAAARAFVAGDAEQGAYLS